ncbi:GDNF family receptor alpha-3 isoform X1 [Podarcis muralis]
MPEISKGPHAHVSFHFPSSQGRSFITIQGHIPDRQRHLRRAPSKAGGLLVLSLDQPHTCITAETLCLAEPACSAAYQTLQNCSQSLSKSSFLPDQETRNRCLAAETFVRNSYFQECKCHRRTRKLEQLCLRIYWTVHFDDFHLEVSPYEDADNEDSSKTNYNKLSTRISAMDRTNPCLHATNVCHLNHKCMRLRSLYAQTCSTETTCDRRRCHRHLRHFFERISADFTKSLLFCPCQDEVCGERRWNTIVPECSFQSSSSSKPNCLVLLDSCLKDNICKSRLADFQEQCKPSGTSSDGCSPHNHAACLEAYMGMVGTPMTPNYASNSSTDVTLWCSCKDSGNQKEDCEQVLSSFASNRCLRSAIQSQMILNQRNMEVQEQLQFTPSLNFQGDATSTDGTVFTSEMRWEAEKSKMQPEVLMQDGRSFPNSVYSGAHLSSLTLTSTLLLLLLGPP